MLGLSDQLQWQDAKKGTEAKVGSDLKKNKANKNSTHLPSPFKGKNIFCPSESQGTEEKSIQFQLN